MAEHERVKSSRHYSTQELLAYLTGWALLGACFTVDHDNAVSSFLSLVGLLTLPGLLIFGVIGYVMGGRRLFRPAALCGTSVWILANTIPTLFFGR
jgi:hypothetical protein